MQKLRPVTVVVCLGTEAMSCSLHRPAQGLDVDPVVPTATQPDQSSGSSLASSPKVERQTIIALLESNTWPRRAIAALRLERFACDETKQFLQDLMGDDVWQVRAFALRTLARRGEVIDPSSFDDEDEPLLVRNALRYRVPIDPQRIARGVRFLRKSGKPVNLMLAAEMAAACDDPDLQSEAVNVIKDLIRRANRTDIGVLSPRLAVLTGHDDAHSRAEWHSWLNDHRRSMTLGAAYGIDAEGRPIGRSPIADMHPEHFTALERYIQDLAERRVDLALCIDCTHSMSKEIAAAQSGMDDLMLFVGDVIGQLRVGLVPYRDKRDEFETLVADFTPDIRQARQRLWKLRASGGGDRPEAVYPALRTAFTELSWLPNNDKVVILIGDAPPQPGTIEKATDLVSRAAKIHLVTHAIQAKGKPVEHFADIASAGGGKCVSLADDDLLIAEIAGLTLGDRFCEEMLEIFQTYVSLCR